MTAATESIAAGLPAADERLGDRPAENLTELPHGRSPARNGFEFDVLHGNEMQLFQRREHQLGFYSPVFMAGRVDMEPLRPTEDWLHLRSQEMMGYGRRRMTEVRKFQHDFPERIKAMQERIKREEAEKQGLKPKERLRWWHKKTTVELRDPLKCLRFNNLTFKPEDLMSAKDIVILELSGCQLGNEQMSWVSAFVQQSYTLRRLFLQGNSIGEEGCRELFLGLRTSKTLMDIDLSLNPIGDEGVSIVCNALAENSRYSKVYKLNVSTCKLSPQATFHLARLIRDFKPLQCLLAWRNNLGCPTTSKLAGIVPMLDELRSNATLRLVDLTCNCISDADAAAHANTREAEVRRLQALEIERTHRGQRIERLQKDIREKRKAAVWDDEKVQIATMEKELETERSKMRVAVQLELRSRTKEQKAEQEVRDRIQGATGVDLVVVKTRCRLILTGNASIQPNTLKRLEVFYDLTTDVDPVAWCNRPRRYDNHVFPRRTLGAEYAPRDTDEFDDHSLLPWDQTFDPQSFHDRQQAMLAWRQADYERKMSSQSVKFDKFKMNLPEALSKGAGSKRRLVSGVAVASHVNDKVRDARPEDLASKKDEEVKVRVEEGPATRKVVQRSVQIRDDAHVEVVRLRPDGTTETLLVPASEAPKTGGIRSTTSVRLPPPPPGGTVEDALKTASRSKSSATLSGASSPRGAASTSVSAASTPRSPAAAAVTTAAPVVPPLPLPKPPGETRAAVVPAQRKGSNRSIPETASDGTSSSSDDDISTANAKEKKEKTAPAAAAEGDGIRWDNDDYHALNIPGGYDRIESDDEGDENAGPAWYERELDDAEFMQEKLKARMAEMRQQLEQKQIAVQQSASGSLASSARTTPRSARGGTEGPVVVHASAAPTAVLTPKGSAASSLKPSGSAAPSPKAAQGGATLPAGGSPRATPRGSAPGGAGASVRSAGVPPAPEEAHPDAPVVLEGIEAIYARWAEIRAMSEVGSPDDAHLRKLEQRRQELGAFKAKFAREIIALGHTITIPADEIDNATAFVEDLVKETDVAPGNAELLQALTLKVDLPWTSMVADRGFAAMAACDSSIGYLHTLLSVPGVRVDVTELASSCFFNQMARIPLTMALFDHPSVVKLESVAEELAPMWQEFFEDIASKRRAIPREDRNRRSDLLRAMLAVPCFTIDFESESNDAQTALSRAANEGDEELVRMMLATDRIQNINLLKSDGTTTLMQAVLGNSPKVVGMLLDKFKGTVDVNVAADNGTALDLALGLARDPLIVALLQQNGAKASGKKVAAPAAPKKVKQKVPAPKAAAGKAKHPAAPGKGPNPSPPKAKLAGKK